MASFPFVPNVPGVPPLLRGPNFAAVAIALLSGDATEALAALLRRPWGLYFGPVPIIFAEAVRSVDLRQDARISDYPVEGGSFASYNKVQQPYQGRIRFMMGGTESERTLMIASVILAQQSLNLYDLVMPEAVYPNVNVTHYDFSRRNDQGNGLLTIDVWCEQVREVATAIFTQTQTPSGAATQSNGTVQTVTVTPASQTSGPAVPSYGAVN